jgi:hypothetical protein
MKFNINARTFLNVLIAILVVFILFHLIVPMTLKDGFEPMDISATEFGDAHGMISSGEDSATKYAKQPAGLSAGALSA